MNNTDQLDTFIKEVTQEIKIEDIITYISENKMEYFRYLISDIKGHNNGEDHE